MFYFIKIFKLCYFTNLYIYIYIYIYINSVNKRKYQKKKRVLEEVEATVKQCVVPVDAGLEAI